MELYVGVGASRVRDLFEQAKKVSPAIKLAPRVNLKALIQKEHPLSRYQDAFADLGMEVRGRRNAPEALPVSRL